MSQFSQNNILGCCGKIFMGPVYLHFLRESIQKVLPNVRFKEKLFYGALLKYFSPFIFMTHAFLPMGPDKNNESNNINISNTEMPQIKGGNKLVRSFSVANFVLCLLCRSQQWTYLQQLIPISKSFYSLVSCSSSRVCFKYLWQTPFTSTNAPVISLP